MSMVFQGWRNKLPKLGEFVSKFLQLKVNQEPIDIYNATTAIICRNVIQNEPNRKITQEDAQLFYAQADNMNRQQRIDYVKENCNQQILSLFRNIADIESSHKQNIHKVYHSQQQEEEQPNTMEKEPKIPMKRIIDKHIYKHRLARMHATPSPTTTPSPNTAPTIEKSQMTLINKIGFELRVRASKVSGNGVFLEGYSVPPGTIVALFGGDVHVLEHATEAYLQKNELLPDPDFMMTVRTDGHIIDGRTSHMNNFNPYAFAHLANHPNADSAPNVMTLKYDFPADILGYTAFPEELRHLIPNKYFKPPSWLGSIDKSILMHSAVLMTTRHVSAGEELLLDYRLNPSVELPSWYTHVNLDSSERRWSL